MDTTFPRDHDGSTLKFYENGPIEDNYGNSRIGGFLLVDLNDPTTEIRVEQRKHERFQIKEVAFAFMRFGSTEPIRVLNKGIGEIACAVFRSKPIKLGKIDNISMGGLAFCHVDGNSQSSELLVLDILLAACGFYLGNMSFETISDNEVIEDFPIDSVTMRHVQTKFKELTPNQESMLEFLIQKYGL